MDVDSERNRRSFRGLVRRWWRLVFVVVVLSMLGGGFILSRQPQLYEARAALLVGSALQTLNPEPSAIEASASLTHIYADLVRRPAIMQAVIDELQLSAQPDSLARQITALARPGSQVLEIMVVDADPRAAQAIANAASRAVVQEAPASQERIQEEMAFTAQQLAEVQRNISSLEGQLRALEAPATGWETPSGYQDRDAEVAGLRAMLSSQRATYAELLSLYLGGNSNTLTVVEPADTSVPVSRHAPLILLGAALSGLVLSVGGIAAREYLDDALRWQGPEQRTCLGLPVLGAIGTVPLALGCLFYTRDPQAPEAEALHDLLANIQLAGPADGVHSLLLTSPGRQDGRSFLAANLAAAVAATGTDVVLVDADLRRPALHEILGVKNERGLAGVLLAKRSVRTLMRRVARQVGQEHLWLVTAGEPVPNPSLVLASPRLREALDLLKKRFEFVIIDGPAEGLAPGAGLLASLADATVLVVRSGSTRQEQGWRCKQAISQTAGANLIGVVFNRAPLERGQPWQPALQVEEPGGAPEVAGMGAKPAEEPPAPKPSKRKRAKSGAKATTAAEPAPVSAASKSKRTKSPAKAKLATKGRGRNKKTESARSSRKRARA
jgi:capsular exopolysaccharide synthesis family protein